jgi:hypothetical protein
VAEFEAEGWSRFRLFSARLSAALVLASPGWAAQATQPTTPPPKGIQWQVGEYVWKLGGYVKVDLIHDFNEIGSTDSFDPRTIPTMDDGDPGDRTRIHARQTRFNVDVQGPTSAGPFRAFAEGDFFSDQNGFRMRHAYGTIGHVLGGQTWTTFMDEAAMPETIDFESPIAFPLVRQAQVRWTQEIGDDGDYFALSLEDPDSDVIPPTGVAGATEEPAPDFNARWHIKNSRGHVQLAGFAGMARFDPDVGSPDDVFLWGLNLSSKFATVGKDSAIVQVTYGDGVGRYRGGTTAAPDSDGDLEAVTVLGLMGSYEHHWSSEYRSSIGYSWGEGDLPSGSPTTSTEDLTYAFANFIWQFTERAWAGVEYLYGTRDTADREEGHANRIQFALRFDV